jgi:SAM-dependent methyltransferase
MKKAIREEYADQGVEAFYRTHANVYENPHFPYIKSLLEKNKNRLDYSTVLDFCGGGGEVALILQDLGYENTTGCDPFTYKLFEKNTGKKCWRFSFEDVVKRKLTAKYPPSPKESLLTVRKPFSAIICSFGMHLCPEKMLQPLVFQLFTLSETLVIITPHKRPVLEEIEGVQLAFDDFTLTERGKKVFLKSYVYPSL